MSEAKTLVFVGTGQFGVQVLECLLQDKRFTIPFVITGLDKPAGRGLKVVSSSIKQTALKDKLIVHESSSIREMKQKLIQEKPDFLLVVSYGEIIPKEILDIPKFGAINIHASLLPKYRGASPIQEAILAGDKGIGITWILMNEKMDAGDIIAQEKLRIYENDDFPILSDRLAKLAAQKTPGVLTDFAKSMTHVRKQDSSSATYCRKITKEDGFIDVYKETAFAIMRRIRAYTPWPGCYILWNGKRLKIIQAAFSEQKISTGEIKIADGKLLIGTKKGCLKPLIVQPESKRATKIEDFLRGQKNQYSSFNNK